MPRHADHMGSHPSATAFDLGVVALNGRREDILVSGEGGPEVAQKVSVTYACDYDHKEIPPGQHRVRRFSFDGRDYEMDLCTWHSDSFDETIEAVNRSRAVRTSVASGSGARRCLAARRRSFDARASAAAEVHSFEGMTCDPLS